MLAAGTRIGPYEISALLDAGGMGEVYRARDTRLKREIALKILPEAFSRDPDRMARFQREAELLATLTHSHIAGIYGLEESDGLQALVLELVEGPTLADRIAEGPLPIEDAACRRVVVASIERKSARHAAIDVYHSRERPDCLARSATWRYARGTREASLCRGR